MTNPTPFPLTIDEARAFYANFAVYKVCTTVLARIPFSAYSDSMWTNLARRVEAAVLNAGLGCAAFASLGGATFQSRSRTGDTETVDFTVADGRKLKLRLLLVGAPRIQVVRDERVAVDFILTDDWNISPLTQSLLISGVLLGGVVPEKHEAVRERGLLYDCQGLLQTVQVHAVEHVGVLRFTLLDGRVFYFNGLSFVDENNHITGPDFTADIEPGCAEAWRRLVPERW